MPRQLVTATNTLYVLENFVKILSLQQHFVTATCCKKSNQTEFVWLVAVTKFCCRDKDFHKISPVHLKWLSLQQVAAASHQTCTHGVICRCNLSPSVYWPLSLKLKVGTHQATTLSNKSQLQITPCAQECIFKDDGWFKHDSLYNQDLVLSTFHFSYYF